MRGYRKRPGTQGFSVPLVCASLFFIISLFLFASYKNSAYQQAKKKICPSVMEITFVGM